MNIRKFFAPVEPATHDYGPGKRYWGHDYTFTPIDDGQRGRATGWGKGIRQGDYLLLANGDQSTRYRVESIKYGNSVSLGSPDDMWKATLTFAPRT